MGHRAKWIEWVALAVVLLPVGKLPGYAATRQPQPGATLAQEQTAEARKAEADHLLQQGAQQYQVSQFQAALQSWQQALELYQDPAVQATFPQESRQGEGEVMGHLGDAYSSLGQYQQAIDLYQQQIEIAKEIGNPSMEVDSLIGIGIQEFQLSQLQEALQTFEQALGIANINRDYLRQINIQNNIGVVYRSLSQYAESLQAYQEALNVSEELESFTGQGDILNNIGTAEIFLGQYTRAIENLVQALRFFQYNNDLDGEAVALTNLGLAYQNLEQSSRALEYFRQAQAIQRFSGDFSKVRSSLLNIGQMYFNLGQCSQALDTFQQALVISLEIGDRRSEAITLSNIASSENCMGNLEEAVETYSQVLSIQEEIGDQRGTGITLNNIGTIYQQESDYLQALSFFNQAFSIASELGDRAGEGIVLSNIAWSFAEGNQPELAIAFYKESVNVRESIRNDIRGLSQDLQQSFTDTVADDYRALADLLLQQNRILEAQQVLDLLRVQELDDYLQDVQRTAQTESGIPLRPEELAALERFATNQDQIVALGRELRQLETIATANRTSEQTARIRELRQLQQDARLAFGQFFNSPEIQAVVAQLRQTTGAANLELGELNALQDDLKDLSQNTVALYPLILDDRLELVVVTANAPPVSRTVNVGREELNRAIADFRSALGSPDRDVVAPAQQLYEWLIRPIEADLAQANAEVVLYAPDGQLRYIPLAALHDGEGWLAQRLQINNIVAASLTDLSNQPFAGGLSVLAAAFTEGQYDIPTSTRTLSFGGLTYAGREVENIARLVPQTDQRLNKAFDQSLVLDMNDFKVVHLATHASFNPGPPQDSFILFGDGSHVTLDQVRRWNFPDVDLVVLSACETAVGDVPLGNGAEILGLGYLMEQAGADAAIASLWAVSDGGTQMLMDAFYANLSQGMGKTEALQQAQIALIEGDFTASGVDRRASVDVISTQTGLPLGVANSLSHPYYWAPFILIGNGL